MKKDCGYRVNFHACNVENEIYVKGYVDAESVAHILRKDPDVFTGVVVWERTSKTWGSCRIVSELSDL